MFTDDSKKLPERVDRLTYMGLAHDLQPVAAKDPIQAQHGQDVGMPRAESELELE